MQPYNDQNQQFQNQPGQPQTYAGQPLNDATTGVQNLSGMPNDQLPPAYRAEIERIVEEKVREALQNENTQQGQASA